jgi:hypothetical protein
MYISPAPNQIAEHLRASLGQVGQDVWYMPIVPARLNMFLLSKDIFDSRNS